MAKKQSAYTRYRNNYLARVRRLNKRGIYLLDDKIPETEKQLKKKGITGKQLTKETNKLKRELKNFKQKEAYSKQTGVRGTVEELRKSQGQEVLPAPELAYRVFRDFVERITEPVPNPSTTRNRTYREALEETRRQQITLTSLIDSLFEGDEDEFTLGVKIIEAGTTFIDNMIKALYASRAEIVRYGGFSLAMILKGSPLTMEEAIDLTTNEWGEEIDYEERFIR